MSSDALKSQGMTFARGDADSPEVFTAIAEITSISGPGGTAAEIDQSDLDSTAKEVRPGLPDNGNVTLGLAYIPKNTGHNQLRLDRENQTLHNFRITFTDASPATTWTFAGYVMGLEINNEVDEITRGTVTIRVNGAVTQA